MQESFRITSLLLGGLVLASVITFIKARSFIASAKRVEAIVVGQRPYIEQRSTRYAQIVQFHLEGQQHESEIKAGVSYPVGTKILVYFSQEDPLDPKIKAQIFRVPIILSVLSVITLLAWGYELWGTIMK